MIRIIILGLTAIVLVGCVSPEEQEARDRAACEQKTGVVRSETDDSAEVTAYDRCRQELEARREAARRSQNEYNIGNYRQNVGR